MQTLAEQFGGQVASQNQKEFGHSELPLNMTLFFLMDLDTNIRCLDESWRSCSSITR